MSKPQLVPQVPSRQSSADTTKALDTSVSKSSGDAIQVVVRFRPLNEAEIVRLM